MREVVVTGGAGFIGSHVCDQLLAEGHRVRVLDNFSTGRPENLAHLREHRHLSVLQADVTAPGALDEAMHGVDWVIHLAALADIVPSIEQPMDYARTNVHGTFAVLDAAHRHGVERFIYAASSSCYGIPEIFPTPETAPCRPQYPYALTKYLGEQAVLHWAATYGLSALCLRLFNVYGPRSRTNGTYGAMFGVFLAQKLAGEPLTVVGDGEQTRDFTYVTDVAGAFLAAASSSLSGEVFNVGTGSPASVLEIAKLLESPVVHIPKRPGEPDCTHADTSRIREALGWSPQVGIEQGVARMLEHIEDWRSAVVWTPESIAGATEAWFEHLGKHDAA